jgi:hypothetical protein
MVQPCKLMVQVVLLPRSRTTTGVDILSFKNHSHQLETLPSTENRLFSIEKSFFSPSLVGVESFFWPFLTANVDYRYRLFIKNFKKFVIT